MADPTVPPADIAALAAIAGATKWNRSQKLTEQQKTEIATLLYSKLGSRACEMCSHTSWAIGENVVGPTPMLMDHVAKAYGYDFSTTYPSILLVCTNCGNSKTFLLNQLGYDPFLPESTSVLGSAGS